MENSKNKIGLKGCKWSNLNGPGTENPLSHPYLKLVEFYFLIIGYLRLLTMRTGLTVNGRAVRRLITFGFWAADPQPQSS